MRSCGIRCQNGCQTGSAAAWQQSVVVSCHSLTVVKGYAVHGISQAVCKRFGGALPWWAHPQPFRQELRSAGAKITLFDHSLAP